jgi:hypothetical protein
LTFLPEHQRLAVPGREPANAKGKKYLQVMILLACVAFGAAMLFSM